MQIFLFRLFLSSLSHKPVSCCISIGDSALGHGESAPLPCTVSTPLCASKMEDNESRPGKSGAVKDILKVSGAFCSQRLKDFVAEPAPEGPFALKQQQRIAHVFNTKRGQEIDIGAVHARCCGSSSWWVKYTNKKTKRSQYFAHELKLADYGTLWCLLRKVQQATP